MASNNYIEPRYTLSNISFVPDPHPSTLGADEFNIGINVYGDIRGARKVLGEVDVFSALPAAPLAIYGVYRSSTNYSLIVPASDSRIYLVTPAGISNITPGVGGNASISLNPRFTANTVFTGDVVGNTLFLGDNLRPPMFLRPTDTEMQVYDTATGFVWNYDTTVTSVTAGVLRAYNSPRGNLILAANLTFNNTDGTVNRQGNTVRWSQRIRNNLAPQTWALTDANIANEIDVPVRGSIQDVFFIKDSAYCMSEVDCAQIYPSNYTGSNTPQFFTRSHTRGIGLHSPNSVTVHDNIAYGIGTGDLWIFDGRVFTSIAEDRVKDYFFRNFNGNKSFVTYNYFLKQVEFYYSTGTSTTADRMLAYKPEENRWMFPRTVNNAVGAIETPFINSDNSLDFTRRMITYANNTTQLIQKDRGNSFSGDPITYSAEKTHIGWNDLEQVKGFSTTITINRIFYESNGGGTFDWSVGTSNSTGDTVDYSDAQTVNVTGYDVDFGVQSGRLSAIKWEGSNTDFQEVTAITPQLKIEGGTN